MTIPELIEILSRFSAYGNATCVNIRIDRMFTGFSAFPIEDVSFDPMTGTVTLHGRAINLERIESVSPAPRRASPSRKARK